MNSCGARIVFISVRIYMSNRIVAYISFIPELYISCNDVLKVVATLNWNGLTGPKFRCNKLGAKLVNGCCDTIKNRLWNYSIKMFQYYLMQLFWSMYCYMNRRVRLRDLSCQDTCLFIIDGDPWKYITFQFWCAVPKLTATKWSRPFKKQSKFKDNITSCYVGKALCISQNSR